MQDHFIILPLNPFSSNLFVQIDLEYFYHLDLYYSNTINQIDYKSTATKSLVHQIQDCESKLQIEALLGSF